MAWFAVFMGLINFFGVISKPRFETYHRLDVARLILVGACFGVAFVVLIQCFAFSGSRPDGGKE